MLSKSAKNPPKILYYETAIYFHCFLTDFLQIFQIFLRFGGQIKLGYLFKENGFKNTK